MSKDDRSILGWLAFAVAVLALFVAAFGLRDEGGASSASETGGGGAVVAVAPTVIDVTMSDFRFEPAMFTIPTSGATIRLTNASASSVHNLEIAALGLVSENVPPGATADFIIPPVAAGDYDIVCNQPGHVAAGMTGMLTVSGSSGSTGGAAAAPAETPTTMSFADMDRMMKAVAQEFPAATEGHGGEILEPTILSDGTKRFDLEAKIVQWELSPGKFVEAWTYNGVVPGPTIEVDEGDKVQIVLKNSLPESTSMHLHGIRVPNKMDGVDPYTQEASIPGETFTYEFTAIGPAVGIYHSHHNAQIQIPNGLFGTIKIGSIPIPQKLIDQGYTQVDKRVNMVLNDAGTIGLSLNGKSFPATEAYTLRVGQVMEVTYQNEGLMAHPMHLHQPMGWIIAKDGNPLDEPQPADTINVAPGERYTVLYKAVDEGVWAWHCHILTHAESSTGMFGMVTALIVER